MLTPDSFGHPAAQRAAPGPYEVREVAGSGGRGVRNDGARQANRGAEHRDAEHGGTEHGGAEFSGAEELGSTRQAARDTARIRIPEPAREGTRTPERTRDRIRIPVRTRDRIRAPGPTRDGIRAPERDEARSALVPDRAPAGVAS
ncbi:MULTISPECIES: hypothetical protein [unclassified Streptomyces]|uniref:hypothetical protein n=1 Tax=unclassified Streptomyces TaxID=2593676 RepID=UPI000F5BC4B3|nr:hypothetical protein [Streptomyces sp. ADI95-17]RPK76740.1 hypothetical protein EES42_02990 [Streptomyces sp. ADI95-17]WSG53220.1 hypothetical protein OHA38_27420 [Streptomyces sp. NBC_01732]WSX03872.1 hypothetical protein OG355_27515 [Streptomyces sp. NBC_00987]